MQAAIYGGGVDVSAEIVKHETAVGCIRVNYAIDVRKLDATVLGVKLGGDTAWYPQAIVDRPAAMGPAPHAGSLSVDGARGNDRYFAFDRLRLFAACILHNDPRL